MRSTLRALALALSLAPAAAGAATFTVSRSDDPAPNGCMVGDCSLREAVIAANADADADTIVLGVNLYILTRAGDGDASIGDLDIEHPVTIQGVSPTQTIVDANGPDITDDRAFSLHDAGAVTLANLTIQDGVADSGGCVKNTNSNLTMTNVRVRNCEATILGGGGVHNLAGGVLTMSGCTVVDNSAAGAGGGLLNESTDGGQQGTVAIVTDSAFAGNHTNDFGGGIASESEFSPGDPPPPPTLTVTGCTVSGNSTNNQAGGISSTAGETIVTNTTIVDNFYTGAGNVGGGFLANGDLDRLINCTVANNGNDAMGLPTGNSWSQIIGSPEVANSIVVSNGDPSCIGVFTPTSLGGNVARDATDDMDTCKLDDPTDRAPVADAGLASTLADNGGPTETLALASGSPALGIGRAAYCPDADQRGEPRADGCDAGAFQLCPSDQDTVRTLLEDALSAVPSATVDWVPCLRGLPGV